MPIQRDHAAEREARIDAFLLAVRRSADRAAGTTEPAPAPQPPLSARPAALDAVVLKRGAAGDELEPFA
jgi:hypothetical protein